MTYQHTIEQIDRELSDLDARRALLLESRATLARLVGDVPPAPSVWSRPPEMPRQSATHSAEYIGESDVDDVDEVPPVSAKAAPAPILCLACRAPFERSGNAQKICGACRALYPTLSIEDVVKRRASGVRVVAGVVDAEGFETLECAGPGARYVEPCPTIEKIRKKRSARGPLRCAACLAEERRRASKNSYKKTRAKQRKERDGEASRHDMRTTESLADDAHGDRELGARGGGDGETRGTEPASAPADAGGPGADRVVEASGRGTVDGGEATTGPALEGDADEEGDREGEPEEEPPALLREHDIQEDLSAPPRRGPGRPPKIRDPKLRQVNERAEKERAAREATDSPTTAGSWWTRPKTREEFSGTAAQRFEETRHSRAAARVKTPSSPAI